MINDRKSKLFESDALVFTSFKELEVAFRDCINQDFKDTYFEANKENWSFNYFLTNSNGIYENTLLIYNKIHHNNDNLGDVMYPVLALKKYKKKLYLWNLLDNE